MGIGPGPTVQVVAGALFDASGRVLIAQRPHDKHMGGQWEFPGGKVAAGETRFAALQRELKEELDVETLAADSLISYEHVYPDRRVVLDLWRVTRYAGTPSSREGQNLRWVEVLDLGAIDLLEADQPMVEALKRYRKLQTEGNPAGA